MATAITKQCSKCGKISPAPEKDFGKKKGAKDGLQHWCKMCQKQSVKAAKKKRPEHYRKLGRDMQSAKVMNRA